jgi:hypothetical protein
LTGFSLFAVGSLQKCGLLSDHLLRPSGAGSHRYGICLRPSYLLSEFCRLGRILSQALHKKRNNSTRKVVLSPRRRDQKESGREGFFSPPFTLTRATWRTSQATVTSVSSSDRHVNATCEQASSVPLITGPQSVDKEGIQGKPGIPNSRSPETMTSKDPGAGGTSPATTSRGEL